MNYRVSKSQAFKKEFKRLAKKYKSLASDLDKLLDSLFEQPLQGVELMQGIRKVRMPIASKGKGKSGGARIIYVQLAVDDDNGVIYLVYIYDKSEIENVSDAFILDVLSHADPGDIEP
jgi:mRNA-degrading endonuclease RelE of RelBE toxin-antitoxin system